MTTKQRLRYILSGAVCGVAVFLLIILPANPGIGAAEDVPRPIYELVRDYECKYCEEQYAVDCSGYCEEDESGSECCDSGPTYSCLYCE